MSESKYSLGESYDDKFAGMEVRKRIAELEATIAELEKALREIAESTHLGNGWARSKARAALLEVQK